MKIETLLKILIGVLLLVLFFGVLNFFKSDSNADGDLMTVREHELKMKLHDADLKIQSFIEMDSISTKKIELYESLIDTTIIRNSDREYRDSLRAILNPG